MTESRKIIFNTGKRFLITIYEWLVEQHKFSQLSPDRRLLGSDT
jgi:hypothetical protein